MSARVFIGKLVQRSSERLGDVLCVTRARLPARLLMVAIPKSGTHLGIQVLKELREVRRRPVVLPPYRPLTSYRRVLGHLARDRFAWGHIGLTADSLRLVREFELKVVVMLRDPRDVVVSFVDHVYRLKPHILKDYYSSLPDETARLRAAIEGAPYDAYPRDDALARQGIYDMYSGFGDIGTVCRNYLAWTEQDDVFSVHFHELVGRAGGGEDAGQLQVVRKLTNFLGLKYDDLELRRICSRIFNPQSATFNKGIQGRWKGLFTEELRDLFKRTAGAELIAMGYETDNNW